VLLPLFFRPLLTISVAPINNRYDEAFHIPNFVEFLCLDFYVLAFRQDIKITCTRKSRWSLRNSCNHSVQNLLSSSLLFKNVKIKIYEAVSRSFRTDRLERETQIVQLSATRCSCIDILWVSLVSSVAITLCVAPQRVIPKISVYFVIDSVRKLLNTPSYKSINSPAVLYKCETWSFSLRDERRLMMFQTKCSEEYVGLRERN
jgi:hypothetical protein